MANVERRTRKHENGNTYVRVNDERGCQKVFGKKFCTPWSAHDGQIHLSKDQVDRLIEGGATATTAVAAYLSATGAGAPAAALAALIGALVGVGIHVLKNDDGSLDVYIGRISVHAGAARIPIHFGVTSVVLLESL
ncbi:MAG: hypothetical protein EP318_21785 [Rhodobacteraceae bacterium]|nr:MAG: hypothetical protein EP318_21785 [Paracoccaceae bacterium]